VIMIGAALLVYMTATAGASAGYISLTADSAGISRGRTVDAPMMMYQPTGDRESAIASGPIADIVLAQPYEAPGVVAQPPQLSNRTLHRELRRIKPSPSHRPPPSVTDSDSLTKSLCVTPVAFHA
jgi:hypothetical protein